jgi:hypothetical protein
VWAVFLNRADRYQSYIGSGDGRLEFRERHVHHRLVFHSGKLPQRHRGTEN